MQKSGWIYTGQMRAKGLFILFLLAVRVAFPNGERKELSAVRITNPPHIDGILDDPVWANDLPVASDFVQYSPYNGEPSVMRTIVKVVYDNSALYIGAMMYDPNPDSIYTELGERDSDFDLNADK